jgi:peroxiredoxin family protein
LKCSFIPERSAVRRGTAEEEKKDTKDDNEIKMERQNIIDAVIVRIMKARKTETHNQLMNDCIHQITLF